MLGKMQSLQLLAAEEMGHVVMLCVLVCVFSARCFSSEARIRQRTRRPDRKTTQRSACFDLRARLSYKKQRRHEVCHRQPRPHGLPWCRGARGIELCRACRLPLSHIQRAQ